MSVSSPSRSSIAALSAIQPVNGLGGSPTGPTSPDKVPPRLTTSKCRCLIGSPIATTLQPGRVPDHWGGPLTWDERVRVSPVEER